MNFDASDSRLAHGQKLSPSEVHSLRQSLAEKEQHLSSTLHKLQSLHTHYAELHQAYSDLRSKQPDNSEFQQQIGQLQTALAIAVAEKTQLQSEVRNGATRQKVLESEIDFLRTQVKGVVNNGELVSLQAEVQQLNEKINNQSTTIAQQRTENSKLEAQIIVLHQDKNDIQSRLNFAYHEKDEIAARLNELKNDLSMKEIYIRQLTKHSSADSAQGQQTIQKLTEQKNFFENECQRFSRDIALLKNEFDTSRRQYEECLAQSREHALKLEQTIEQLANQKRQLEFSKFCLEEELQLLRKNAHDNLAQQTEKVEDPVMQSSSAPSEVRPEFTQFDYDALKNSYQRVELDLQKQNILIGQLNAVLEERDATIEKLQHQTTEDEHKIQRLESQIQHFQQMNTDVAELSNQLQNERSTVSRAISQNMELKEQFGELQDKLIQMTNDYAQAEDQKTNALALVEKLSRKIEEMESTQPKPLLESVVVQTDAAHVVPSSVSNQESTTTQTDQIAHLQQTTESLNYSHISNVHYSEQESDTIQKSQHPDPSESRDDSDSTEQSSSFVEDSASATPETVELSAVSQDGNEDETSFEQTDDLDNAVQDFLSNPKSSDSDFMLHLRQAFFNFQENNHKLKEKVETLEKLNSEYKESNERLQYWLTSVESENESIGDFIELYRVQRAQIQAKVLEKEEECENLRQIRNTLESRIQDLHTSLLGFLKKSQGISDIDESSGNDQLSSTAGQSESSHSKICAIHDLMRILTQMSHEQKQQHSESNDHLTQLTQTLQNSSIQFNPELHCSECKGELYDL